MSMSRRRLLAALVASCGFALCGAASAKSDIAPEPHAAPQAARELETLVEVSVLHGTREKRPDDAQTVRMPELREGPFARYASYSLLSREVLPLIRGGKRQLKLPNGRRLEALLEDILADGSSRLVASINRPNSQDFLPLLAVKARPGQSFIVAGQSYKQGILVLVFKVLR